MSEGARRRVFLVLLVALGVVLLWGVWNWWEIRSYRRAMAVIDDEIADGLNGLAARNLEALLAWKPNSDEALYRLGTCEMARGRIPAADAAWARVPPYSPFAAQAMVGRVQIQMELYRLADAEQMIEDALANPQIDGASLRAILAPVYLPQGRLDDTLRVIEARWDALDRAGEGASEAAINLLRLHIDVRLSPGETEVICAALEQAARTAPEDDRVWLARANQAIRDGAFDEAARWLDACLKRRPEDPAVWRARLNWAIKSNRVESARQALAHLPAETSTPAGVQKLSAWFAARRGDVAAERRALERLVTDDPADLAAVDRLAEIAIKDGQSDRASELRRSRAEIDEAMARYLKLHKRHQPSRDAAEMGRLAERLGQWFEARAFLTLAVAVDPDRAELGRALARIRKRGDTAAGSGRTLAELLAPELGDDPITSNRRPPASATVPSTHGTRSDILVRLSYSLALLARKGTSDDRPRRPLA
jgi:thioredoxin-like negative regulator of GroEL